MNASIQHSGAENNFGNIPEPLTRLIQWCCWKYEATKGKVPYNPKTGRLAASDNPQTWCSFTEAVEAAPRYNGIGFFFSEDDPYCGIDLDDPYALKADGTLVHADPSAIFARQLEIFNKLDSYSEYSPSGKGLHIIVEASISSGRKRDAVEVYSSARYFTMTGNVVNNVPISERQDVVDILLGEMSPQSSNNGDASEFYRDATETDDEILRQLLKIDKFVELANTVPDTGETDDSSVDLALVNIIQKHTKDPAQIERIWMNTTQGRRPKTQTNANYRKRTIEMSFDNELPPVDFSGLLNELNRPKAAALSGEVVAPVDLWANFDAPALPEGLLPTLIEQFARVQAVHMGADPSGLAAAALAVCAAAIPDHVRLQVKRHDLSWTENARIWVALIGMPSTKKSPIIKQAARPLRRIDTELFRAYAEALAGYEALDKAEQKAAPSPRQERLLFEDTTIEAAQEVLRTARTVFFACKMSFQAGSEAWTNTQEVAARRKIAGFGCNPLMAGNTR